MIKAIIIVFGKNMNNYFKKIPNEIFLLICSFLECKDCLILKQVCKDFSILLEKEKPLKSPELFTILDGGYKHYPLYNYFTISSDGKKIIDGSDIWDLETKKYQRLNEEKIKISTIFFLENDKKIIVTSPFNKIEMWDIIKSEVCWSYKIFSHTKSFHLFPSEKNIAFSEAKIDEAGGMSFLYYINVLDTKTGKSLFKLPMHKEESDALISSPDEKYLAAATHFTWGIKIWDLEKKKFFQLIYSGQYSPQISSMIYFSNGKKIISGSCYGKLEIWDVELGTNTLTLTRSKSKILALSLFAKEKKVISASLDGNLDVWNLIEKNHLYIIPMRQKIYGMIPFPKKNFDNDGDYEKIISKLADGRIEICKIPICPIHDK